MARAPPFHRRRLYMMMGRLELRVRLPTNAVIVRPRPSLTIASYSSVEYPRMVRRGENLRLCVEEKIMCTAFLYLPHPTLLIPRSKPFFSLHAPVTEEGFYAFFNQFGPVVDSVVMVDRLTKRSRGFGFVTFANAVSVVLYIYSGIVCVIYIHDNSHYQCRVFF